MSVTGKITGLTMIVAGFTFFAWFIALNTISPSIPEGLQGTSRLFMILSAVTGLGFLISGGLSVFGHGEYEEKQNNPAKSQVYKPLPKPLFSKPSAPKDEPAEDEEDVAIEVGEEKKTDEGKETEKKKEGWEAPSKTGWG